MKVRFRWTDSDNWFEGDLIMFKAEGVYDKLEDFGSVPVIIVKAIGGEESQFEWENGKWWEINESQTPVEIDFLLSNTLLGD